MPDQLCDESGDALGQLEMLNLRLSRCEEAKNCDSQMTKQITIASIIQNPVTVVFGSRPTGYAQAAAGTGTYTLPTQKTSHSLPSQPHQTNRANQDANSNSN